MDLNSAIHTAECGGHVRCDRTMRAGWTIRWVKAEKLLYFYDPNGDKRHKVMFNDAHRSSVTWQTVP